MTRRDVILVLMSLLFSAVTFSVVGGAHANQEAAVDRALMERMVRALEDQARQTDKLVQATERCKR